MNTIIQGLIDGLKAAVAHIRNIAPKFAAIQAEVDALKGTINDLKAKLAAAQTAGVTLPQELLDAVNDVDTQAQAVDAAIPAPDEIPAPVVSVPTPAAAAVIVATVPPSAPAGADAATTAPADDASHDVTPVAPDAPAEVPAA